jgi:hypothetical protein
MHLKTDNRRLTQIDPEDRLLKLKDAAELCDISVQILTAAINRGEIRVVELAPKDKVKGPKTRRVLLRELHRWWRSKMTLAIVPQVYLDRERYN